MGYLMGYLTMCALSARARRCGSCVLPSPCPRGDLSTWCVERAIAAATLQGVPGARPGDCVVGLLCMVMQPPEPVATDQAGRRRAHAASWLPRLRHRRGQAPGPHACGASTGRLIADALCPPDPRRSETVSHDRTAMRCRAADLGWPVSQWCHQETLDPHGWLTEDEVTRKRRERSRTMWASEDALPVAPSRICCSEPRTEGRAIDPAAVERMFDATRGAHISRRGSSNTSGAASQPQCPISRRSRAWCAAGVRSAWAGGPTRCRRACGGTPSRHGSIRRRSRSAIAASLSRRCRGCGAGAGSGSITATSSGAWSASRAPSRDIAIGKSCFRR